MLAPGLTSTLNSHARSPSLGPRSMTAQSPATMSCCTGPKRARKLSSFTSPTMGNTATTDTDTGTDLDIGYGYLAKAKNAHGLRDVSNFDWTDT